MLSVDLRFLKHFKPNRRFKTSLSSDHCLQKSLQFYHSKKGGKLPFERPQDLNQHWSSKLPTVMTSLFKRTQGKDYRNKSRQSAEVILMGFGFRSDKTDLSIYYNSSNFLELEMSSKVRKNLCLLREIIAIISFLS